MFRVVQLILFMFIQCQWVENVSFIDKKHYNPFLQVRTANGYIQGIQSQTMLKKIDLFSYVGIPYAQPPVGHLRFRAPQRYKSWKGVLDATETGAACMELRFRQKVEITGTENCLFLNVFTPQNPNKIVRLLPVMVWIHGGAFIEGSANRSLYGPDYFMEKDVIIVTFNYRLGAFGFLSTEDDNAPGNYGLKDQNLVLRWVQRNIRSFGGNPSMVTIFGESAGAASVHYQMQSPMSKGLFHKAIAQSGTTLSHWAYQKKPLNLAYLLGIANGINAKSNKELVERLRKVSSEDLHLAQLTSTFLEFLRFTLYGIPFAPSIEHEHEGAFITKFGVDTLANGQFNQVPLLTGVNANETLFFTFIVKILKPFLFLFDVDPGLVTSMALDSSQTAYTVGNIIKKYYLGNEQYGSTKLENIFRILDDQLFIRPSKKAAILMSKYIPVFFYHFSYSGEITKNGIVPETRHADFPGVGHAEDVFYLWHTPPNPATDELDKKMIQRMVTLWTNFAKYGNPTPKADKLLDNVIWPIVNPNELHNLNYLEINVTMSIRHRLKEEDMTFWDDLFRKYSQPPLITY